MDRHPNYKKSILKLFVKQKIILNDILRQIHGMPALQDGSKVSSKRVRTTLCDC